MKRLLAVLFLMVIGLMQGCGSDDCTGPKCEVCPDCRLVAYYPFDEDASDASGNGHHGVVNGATLVTDNFGTGYRFDGDDYIEVPHHPDLNLGTGEVTFIVRVKLHDTPTPDDCPFFCKYGFSVYGSEFGDRYGYSLAVRDDLKSYANIQEFGSGSIAECHTPLELETAYWLVGRRVWEEGQMMLKYYINDELKAEVQSDKMCDTRAPLIIGATKVTLADKRFQRGTIYSLRIYNAALTEEEVSEIIQAE